MFARDLWIVVAGLTMMLVGFAGLKFAGYRARRLMRVTPALTSASRAASLIHS